MNWTLFAGIAQQIQTPLLTAVQGVSNSMLAAVAGPFQAAVVIYVAMVGMMIIGGRMVEPLRDTWGRLAKVAVVAFMLTGAAYTQYVSNLFLTALPNDIANSITGVAGTVSAASFDHIWNKAFAGGLEVWKNLSWTDIGLQILIVVYWMAAAVACAFGFLIWLVAQILIGLFVAVGPLILPMFLFPATRSVFERWIGALLSCIFLQVFVVTMLVVLTAAENTLLANVTIAGAGNAIAQIQVLFGAIILFLVACVIVVQLPGAATALAGGMHFHAQSIGRATFGNAMAMARVSTGRSLTAIGNGAGATRRLIQARNAPGPSLSTSNQNQNTVGPNP